MCHSKGTHKESSSSIHMIYLNLIFCVFPSQKSRNMSEFVSPNPQFDRLFCARFGHLATIFTHSKGWFCSLNKESDGWKAPEGSWFRRPFILFFSFTAHAHMRVACSCVRQMCVKCVLFPSHLTAKVARSRALSFIATVAQWGSATVTVVLATVTHQQQPLAPSLPPPPPSSSHPPARSAGLDASLCCFCSTFRRFSAALRGSMRLTGVRKRRFAFCVLLDGASVGSWGSFASEGVSLWRGSLLANVAFWYTYLWQVLRAIRS